MKRLTNIILVLAVLIPGLWGCQPEKVTPVKVVDLRYRVDDSYELEAISPRTITIVVASTDPWTITTTHPEWCMIDIEEGEGSPADSVHVGLGTKTTVHVQYYDNDNLDDRDDIIEIRSDYWLGKKVKVHQKGTAFLKVEKDAIAPTKATGNYTVNVLSNQKWSAKFIQGDTVTLKNKTKVGWISIAEGASGEGNGAIKIAVQDNPEEQRQAIMALYDRKGVEQARVTFTQAGVLLEVSQLKLRVGYNQTQAEIYVDSNADWTVEKSATDTWFTVGKTSYHGQDTVKLTLQVNEGEVLRFADIRIATVAASAGAYVAERDVEVKQGYKVTPVVTLFNQAEYDTWKEQSAVHATPAGTGMQFTSGVKLQKNLPFGDYSFYWKDMSCTPGQEGRLKTLFAFGAGQEVKYYLSIESETDAYTSIGFNTGTDGENTAPKVKNVDFDPSVPHKITYSFMPIIESEFCTVSFFLDDVFVTSFTSAEKVMYEVKWGSTFNTYIEVDQGGQGALEKYEYSAPVDWGD